MWFRNAKPNADEGASKPVKSADANSAVQAPMVIQDIQGWCVVEFKTASLMETMELTRISAAIYPLVDEQGKRRMIVDFSSVQYISSQAIGILLTLNRKLNAQPKAKLVLCGVSPKLLELLKITRLDRILTTKPTLAEALTVT